MSSDTAIRIRNVSLAYKLYAKPADVLWEATLGNVRHDVFWALKNINLEVKEGQRLGLIGPNGAGKSSLLQVIAGNITPTSGSISVNGKISSLLSMTPAWNPEDTGIENIRMNLLVQGVSRSKIKHLTEDIIDFTNLGAFIYQPVKTYSSGMGARLAFGIATAIEPEVLIVDEVLGTGDGYFAARATKRMQEMCARGKALVFVSHSTSAVRMLCDTCAWIESGEVRAHGDVNSVIQAYEEDMLLQDMETNRSGNRARLDALRDLATPAELVPDGKFHLRIRPQDAPVLTDTHYIRDLSMTVDGETRELGLEEQVSVEEAAAGLDLFSCEWGRFFERGGRPCRVLQPRAGVKKGGQAWARHPEDERESVSMRLEFEYSSISGHEKLGADILDPNAAFWKPMAVVSEKSRKGWTRVCLEGEARVPNPEMAVRAAEVTRVAFRKPVEIADVGIFVDGQRRVSVRELEPFTIRVVCNHNEAVPEVCVNLGIWRSDGIQAWWSSSGYLADNIRNHEGRSTIDFKFDPNPFGYGQFSLHVYVVNGFAWDNSPCSEIYDVSAGEKELNITLTRPIQFGMLNLDPAVSIQLEKNFFRGLVKPKSEPGKPAPLVFPADKVTWQRSGRRKRSAGKN